MMTWCAYSPSKMWSKSMQVGSSKASHAGHPSATAHSSAPLVCLQEIDELRAEAQFRRDYDGHVWVQARNGQWCEVRLDAQVGKNRVLGARRHHCQQGQLLYTDRGL
jgi:hypothetical protein